MDKDNFSPGQIALIIVILGLVFVALTFASLTVPLGY